MAGGTRSSRKLAVEEDWLPSISSEINIEHVV